MAVGDDPETRYRYAIVNRDLDTSIARTPSRVIVRFDLRVLWISRILRLYSKETGCWDRAPKGPNSLAQGNALGPGGQIDIES